MAAIFLTEERGPRLLSPTRAAFAAKVLLAGLTVQGVVKVD
jgi:hypothetical protein